MTSDRVKFQGKVLHSALSAEHNLRRISVRVCHEVGTVCCNKPLVGICPRPAPFPGETPLTNVQVSVELNGWYLNEAFVLADYTAEEFERLRQTTLSQFQFASGYEQADNDVSNVIASNLNHFARSGIKTFSGIVFSSFEQTKISKSLSYESAYRLCQAALAENLRNDAPFIQVHEAGDPPKTKADAQFLQHYLTKHRAGQPGCLSRIVLFRGAPYLLSIVFPETAEALTRAHSVNGTHPLALAPTSKYVGSFEGMSLVGPSSSVCDDLR
tara:strand:+ start:120 stop:929 length:810 start_codon:yes stop_codon:yes gene_type:complete